MKKNKVQDWMSTNPHTITAEATIPEAHDVMKKNKVRRLPVLKNGKLIGIVTRGDVREAGPSDATSLSIYELNYLLAKLTIESIMTPSPIVVSPDTSLHDAARLMLDNKIGGLPVVEGEKLVGIITESDVFRALMEIID
ncbi:MAG: CBS domain-containing protein [Anaerolineae bacterium]|nr:CBS domain-containing protein [Anaerolineae bacterium]